MTSRTRTGRGARRPVHMTRDGLEYGPGTVTNPRIRDLECRFHFEDPGWNPEVGLWSIERARMERAFRHALDAYEARMRGMAERQGIVRTPTKRNMRLHCEWWVRNRLLREGQDAIARKESPPVGIDRSSVRDAIRDLIRLLEVGGGAD